MCGFAGFLNQSVLQIKYVHDILNKMSSALTERGPDSSGFWYDNSNFAVVHRRLSILDLSDTGKQPMVSHCGRYIIAFNGEIYNYQELKLKINKEGKPYTWRGNSDTEVFLEAIAIWGIEKTLEISVGMFAFALWNTIENELILCRDRLGEKPLYYGWQRNGVDEIFLFSSDLKAIQKHPFFKGEIDRDALSLFMKYNYVPTPYCIYKSLYKLEQGTYLKIRNNGRIDSKKKYWNNDNKIFLKSTVNIKENISDYIKELDEILRSSVKSQMVADVETGAFLSGGIDSTTIVAMMQSMSEKPIKTFTIGFNEKKYDESEFSKTIARYLKTDHHELIINDSEALEVINKLPYIYSEPFSDSSQIPTYLVSQLASRHVKVTLSGDGGDELFGGYNRYVMVQKYRKYLSLIPINIRRKISNHLYSKSVDEWDRIYDALFRFIPQNLRVRNFGEKIHKGSSVLSLQDTMEMYQFFVSHWKENDMVIGSTLDVENEYHVLSHIDFENDTKKMMAIDTVTYLPDDILVKLDRASMAVSLETRVPFLDHRVVEYAWKLPDKMKIHGNEGKWLLRKVLDNYVPKSLVDRPKMGFGIPLDEWLRGPLREWAEDLLEEARMKEEGFFNHKKIQQKWREHLMGIRNWQYHLWDVLMFQSWYRHNLSE